MRRTQIEVEHGDDPRPLLREQLGDLRRVVRDAEKSLDQRPFDVVAPVAMALEIASTVLLNLDHVAEGQAVDLVTGHQVLADEARQAGDEEVADLAQTCARWVAEVREMCPVEHE